MMDPITRRRFLERTMFTGAAMSVPTAVANPLSHRMFRSAPIRVGVIGVRGRGRGHIGAFNTSPDAEVVAICDCDEGVIELAMEAAPSAVYHKDIRRLLDDPSIDAISIAMPNHWHSLATIWALQAGKHVYVEKPISHNVFEGRQVVEAAHRYGRIVQHGTQARSHTATRDAMQWLHEGGLGRVHVARGLCYKRRTSIGKVTAPQTPPVTLDYDLWTGPAEMGPLMRTNLHYDWHWDYNTGNGDMGNQGVHQMDIARWGLGLTRLPTQVASVGGRLGYDDDGNTANTQVATYDYGDQKIIFEVRGLVTDPYRSAHIGVIFHGERGHLVSASYAKLVAYDHDGNVMKTFEGGGNHFQSFLDAVRNDDAALLNATALDGHVSTSLCHLGNISYRLGTRQRLSSSDTPFDRDDAANESFDRLRSHVVANGLDPASTDYFVGEKLTFDPANERFKGVRADEANRLLTRAYRAPYIVPTTL